MIKRDISVKIDEWINNGKNALMITGARQTGKTYIIRDSLKKSRLKYIEINFISQPELKSLFSDFQDIKTFLFRLSAFYSDKLIKGETIIFLDEIQECKEIVSYIKFLVDDGTYRYIMSGSLLGVEINNLRSAPVGYLTICDMYPVTLKEFYKAIGLSDEVISVVKNCFKEKKPVDELVHKKLMEAFYLYLMVGGMPQAVEKYLTTNDMDKVTQVHKDIERLYKLDFSKYESEKNLRIKEIYDSIPGELNNQNKRFFLNKLGEKTSITRTENSFLWLKDAGVSVVVYNVTEPMIPLKINEKRNLFKLFLLDVGMLTSMYPISVKLNIFNRDANINNGALFENAVAEQLTAKGYDIYYYNSKKFGELDFLIERNGKVLPIEVKSGKDYKIHSALNNVLKSKNYEIDEAIVFTNDNVQVEGNKVYLPIYMVMFIEEEKLPQNIIKLDLSDLSKI